MSPRARVAAIVAGLAALAAVAAVAVAAAYAPDGRDREPVQGAQEPEPRRGSPPLAFRFPLRTDEEAIELLRGARLLEEGRAGAAGRVFSGRGSLEAKVGSAFAAWPQDTVDRMIQLAGLFPRSSLVQVHLGLALYWARLAGAEDAWREARDAEPDSPYAIVASDLLHPETAPGLPIFVPSLPLPARAAGRQAAEQLELLRRLASQPAAERESLARTLYLGVALQRAGRPLSARAVFDDAGRQAPNDPDARVAAAVGRFDKDQPAVAFGTLGPLTQRFPRAATVRFHLGLLLLWTGRLDEATRQLRLARTVEPRSPLAHEAGRWLDRLEELRQP